MWHVNIVKIQVGKTKPLKLKLEVELIIDIMLCTLGLFLVDKQINK